MELKLFTPIQYVKGVGPKRAKQLERLGIFRVYDLLYFAPRKYLDRRNILKIREVSPGTDVVIIGEVVAKGIEKRRREKVFKVIISDGSGWIELVWKSTNENFLKALHSNFGRGDRVIVTGKVSSYRGIKQIWFPEYEVLGNGSEGHSGLVAGRIIPVYPSTEGLKPKFLRKLVYSVLLEVKDKINETLPTYIRTRHRLYPRATAIKKLHFPDAMDEVTRARKTLAFEELFYFCIQILGRRLKTAGKGIPLVKSGELTDLFLKSLPFELTDAQKRVIGEIESDVARPVPMHRLLQGDVGSGKTVVALYAMLLAVENGYQAAIMAPTEILAEQHFIVISEFLKDIPVNVRILTGSLRKKERKMTLQEIESGDAKIIVGTHALIQEDVEFKNLAFAVVDEQHRFGVVQRAKLLEKGSNDGTLPHFLVMTATPIPRTLAMTLYGDLDVSILDEKPPKRGRVITVHRYEDKRQQIYSWLFDRVRQGDQAYVVAPLIEKSQKLEVKAAQELFDELKSMAPQEIKIGLIHGRMKKDERQFVMRAFRDGEFGILVATTVIEVGIDVPNATIMIIEHAERFGLAQLHQLRGRIGRSEKTSYCVIITPRSIGEDARKRIAAFVKITDGFELAEIDLKIRGPGELIGTRQHGLPDFKIVDLVRDRALVASVRNEVVKILKKDPALKLPQHRLIRAQLKIMKEQEVLYVA